ncbi:hypothetical protein [Allomesorhizobium camelthorni]|uniref:Tip attachment protein J domain-containing protein n=1 Tax=Allomesorhizobium camelthorni TaxID=475069 RepID=A0A6G4W739_9HYPH|nr:hypothetical protein [Mesorhizobium camelthorni]NGO50419.1 hypothetical protein [Mesorhizobium camelthorni]
MRPRLSDAVMWDGNDPRRLKHARTGFIEGWIFYALVATLPGLSNAALGFLATGLTTLATTGLSIAVNLAFQQKPPTPKAQDIQSNIRQALAARRRHYGRTKVGSVIVFGFRRSDKLYILHYIGEGPIAGFVSYFLDRKPVTLDVNGFVQESQYEVNDKKRVQIMTKLGTMADEPFDELIAAFPELDRPLKPFRHRGCAMLLQIVEEVGQEDITDVYPNNLPSLEVIIDGLKPFEPRTAVEAFSDNAGVCLLAEIMNVYGLTSTSADDIDFDAFADFADHSDEAVALKAGGTEKRYRCAGTILMDAENEARIKTIANICNADVYMNPEGKISVRKRVSSTPSIALKAEDGDHLSISLESGRREQKKFNAVKVLYREALLNWKENEAYYRNAAAKLVDGKELVEPLEAGLCPSGTQAQRLGKLFFHENNPDTVGTMVSGAQSLELVVDPVFTLDLAPEDDLEFVARAGGIEFDANTQTVSFQLQSVDPDAEAWNPATEEQNVVELPPALPSQVEDQILDVTATVGLLSNSAPVINFSWVLDGSGNPVPDTYSQQVQVSVAGLGEWESATVNQDEDTARFGPVADGAAYDWRIRNIRGGRQFDWQQSAVPVTVTVDTVAPLALLTFSASDGTGQFVANFGTQNDSHLATVAVYKVPTGGVLDRPTHLVAPRYAVAPGISYSLPITSAVGTFDIYVEPFNRSSIAGPLAGPDAAIVT